MKISYLVTCCVETHTLKDLLELVWAAAMSMPQDEVVIVHDGSNNPETLAILDEFRGKERVRCLEHQLDHDYGRHKNWATSMCTGDYIFQIDGDELPSEYLIGENLHQIIESNPQIELYWVPRVNDFEGVTPSHAAQWGWNITLSKQTNKPIVNWPDYQGRIYKNDYPRIRWEKKLHEQIAGANQYAPLPCEDETLSLWHRKTIEKQVETNLHYNKTFTAAENRGQG